MSPDFGQRYECSTSNSFSPMLRGNCPCILFPCHLSLVFSAMLTFIFLVSLSTSVLRHLSVCNTAESVLCWCVLTTCISGFSFLQNIPSFFQFLLCGLLLSASSPFLPVFWKHTSDLHLLSSDAVHKWLLFSLFSGLVLQFFLVPVNNSKTVSKYRGCQ